MNKQDIIATLATRKSGQFFSIAYAGQPSGLTASAKRTLALVKRKSLTLQACDYAKRQAVSEAIKSGKREAPKMASWMEYDESADGNESGAYFGKHKVNGTVYLCSPLNNESGETVYELDGKRVELEAIREHFTKSALEPKASKQELA